MATVLSIEETIHDVVCSGLEADHAEVDAHTNLEMFAVLRHEFPQATIVTLSLADLLKAAYTSMQSLDD
jgi:hypothetical protein